jgi:asparagine synthase (glutamine-hydrolysing)
LVALTATRLGEPLRTFSCIYPQYPVLDESAYIRLTTQQFAANATYTTPALPLDAPLAAIDRCIYEQDGPTGTPAVWSQRAVMQLASPHVRVLLDGQGGDEVLGGYHSYFPWALRGLMRQALRQPWQVQRWQAWQQSASAIAARQQGQAAPSWRTAYEGLGQAGGLLKRGLPPAKFDAHPWGASALDVVQPIAEDDLSTRMLQDLMYSSLPALLHYEDRNSMAFSIESRLPFLDYRLVSWVYALPPRFKIRQARTKWLLFETMKDILPHPVAYRREKLGYETPGSAWLLAPEVANVLDKVLKHPPEALAALPPDYWQKRATQWQQCRREGQVPAKIERVLWRLLTVVRWLSMEAARKQPPGVLGHDAQPPAPVLC